ncbi:hypothetical protein E5676_scaffold255G007260 [Cucumis melo var. makuwa]|uniref:Uncharacterized protein n=1 Tax=Cucumis melo var. makuwa TaxID=1194695 RepID=A0A5D3CRT7_CUCMM|nr:hypothetical protein E6C27_scaffold120G003210 [Cucumis melo var. makuwa]TYK13116.1 hypothetical protein E5676_scaffold255G007260 [Cucumis melo var. makuwa]
MAFFIAALILQNSFLNCFLLAGCDSFWVFEEDYKGFTDAETNKNSCNLKFVQECQNQNNKRRFTFLYTGGGRNEKGQSVIFWPSNEAAQFMLSLYDEIGLFSLDGQRAYRDISISNIVAAKVTKEGDYVQRNWCIDQSNQSLAILSTDLSPIPGKVEKLEHLELHNAAKGDEDHPLANDLSL